MKISVVSRTDEEKVILISGTSPHAPRSFSIVLTAVILASGTTGLAGGSPDTLQTGYARDTVFAERGDTVLVLSHPFIIKGSEEIAVDGKALRAYRIQSVSGTIILDEPDSPGSRYVVSYRYLIPSFPAKLDPPLASLPRLDNDSTSRVPRVIPRSLSQPKSLPLAVDGAIFRGFSLSPSMGMSLDGGLHLNLQGRLSDDMTVSGTLSDQNSPIPPGGDTQALSEIDKVYLQVNHPTASIQAGDLDMDLPFGRFLTVSRRLEGLHLRWGSASGGMEGYLGGTRGRFHRQEIRGEDRNQGPYSLFTETGQGNIRILAGSERVWVDGERMHRGENRDYTIDYTRGEITFTPNRLIDNNSRIYVEFEYSDLVYPRKVSSLALHRSFPGDRTRIAVGWVREKDDLDSRLPLGLGAEERQVLARAGDRGARIPTASRDPDGDYVRTIRPDDPSDSVYAYVAPEDRTGGQPLYRVSFHNLGPRGEYLRKVAPDGSVFFEYVPEAERTSATDLYVPWKLVPSPESHQMVNVVTEVSLFDSTRVMMELAGSQRDRNLISRRHDGDNLGAAGSVEIRHTQPLPGRAGTLTLAVHSRRLDGRFSPLQRDREVEFDREWNLVENRDAPDSLGENDFSVNTFELIHQAGERLNSLLSYGVYADGSQGSRRWHGSTHLSSRWIPQLTLDLTKSIRSLRTPDLEAAGSVWSRRRLGVLFLPGRVHPYIRHDEEERTTRFRFRESSGGFKASLNRVDATVGITRREDFSPGPRQNEWDPESGSWLGEAAIKGRWPSGYRIQLLVKEQRKTSYTGGDDITTSLARGSAAYRPRKGIVTGDVDFKLEQTLYEERIAVYDSVGKRMGQYRYDVHYDQYIPDADGDYAVRYLRSGIRTPAKRLVSAVNVAFDFRRGPWALLRPLRWRAHGSSDVTGQVLNRESIVRPSTVTPGLNRAQVRFRQDFHVIPPGSKRRFRLSTRHTAEVTGSQTVDWMERGKDSYEISLEEPISADITGTVRLSGGRTAVASRVEARNRRVTGWSSALGVRWRPSTILESGGDLYLGRDRVAVFDRDFSSRLTGGGWHVLWFPHEGGRIHATVDYFAVATDSPVEMSLPPESSRGLPLGDTYRASLTGLFVLGSTISANINVSYTMDSIHDELFSISGEIRATF